MAYNSIKWTQSKLERTDVKQKDYYSVVIIRAYNSIMQLWFLDYYSVLFGFPPIPYVWGLLMVVNIMMMVFSFSLLKLFYKKLRSVRALVFLF